ncbi:hypothetical protein J1N35_028618 [Gossypium stocksii]|uniref:Uncharacterized protein n=1 Tax=Gossypium stocksii TaxID=47602 RepID=A0A9D3UWA1_9ROSI|nr:hypothetical protein J1N35_028618 [Gossypium stocksii]
MGRKTKGLNPVWPNSNNDDGSSTARTSQILFLSSFPFVSISFFFMYRRSMVNGDHSGAIRALTVARHLAVEGAIRALIVAHLEQ